MQKTKILPLFKCSRRVFMIQDMSNNLWSNEDIASSAVMLYGIATRTSSHKPASQQPHMNIKWTTKKDMN